MKNSLDLELRRLDSTEYMLIQYLRSMTPAQRELFLSMAWRMSINQQIPNNVVSFVPRP